MRTHQQIDARSLALAQAIVEKIDGDPARTGLAKAKSVCERWTRMGHVPGVEEWNAILEHPWGEIRAILLDESEEGQRLRQNSPFCGTLSPHERWRIYRDYRDHDTTTT